MTAGPRRYAAFLRGVSPMNAKMPELKKSFEAAGFTDVRTLLSSGNVLFSAPAQPAPALEQKAVAAMEAAMGRSFPVIVRTVDALRAILATDPYGRLPEGSKRVVTFLRKPPKPEPALPVELHGARIVCVRGSEAFSAYVRSPHGPVFMTLIEKTFGKDATTRTWDTVRKMAT